LPLDYAYALKDAEGQILREELEKIGFLGDRDELFLVKSPLTHIW